MAADNTGYHPETMLSISTLLYLRSSAAICRTGNSGAPLTVDQHVLFNDVGFCCMWRVFLSGFVRLQVNIRDMGLPKTHITRLAWFFVVLDVEVGRCAWQIRCLASAIVLEHAASAP